MRKAEQKKSVLSLQQKVERFVIVCFPLKVHNFMPTLGNFTSYELYRQFFPLPKRLQQQERSKVFDSCILQNMMQSPRCSVQLLKVPRP